MKIGHLGDPLAIFFDVKRTFLPVFVVLDLHNTYFHKCVRQFQI
jgi:hypothetical protein